MLPVAPKSGFNRLRTTRTAGFTTLWGGCRKWEPTPIRALKTTDLTITKVYAMLATFRSKSRRSALLLTILGAAVALLLVGTGSSAQAKAGNAAFYESPDNEGDNSVGGNEIVASLKINALSTDPATVGTWQVLSYKMPINGVHFAVLRTGNVLICAGSGNVKKNNEQHLTYCAEWNTTTGVMKKLPIPEDLFCSGHSELPDGQVLFNGGTKYLGFQGDNGGKWGGLASTYQFNPDDDTFTRYADMIGAVPRIPQRAPENQRQRHRGGRNPAAKLQQSHQNSNRRQQGKHQQHPAHSSRRTRIVKQAESRTGIFHMADGKHVGNHHHVIAELNACRRQPFRYPIGNHHDQRK